EPIRRTARSRVRVAVSVRVALRTNDARAGAGPVPLPVSAVGATGTPIHDARRECLRGGIGVGGEAIVYVAAAGVHQPSSRSAGTSQATRRGLRRVARSVRASDARRYAGVQCRQ